MENNVTKVQLFGEIITKRPEKMSFKEYRQVLQNQNKKLKSRLKGILVPFGQKIKFVK